MAFQYVGGASGVVSGSGTEVSCSGALDIAAGDLLVAVAKWDGVSTTVGIADGSDSSNAFTMLDVVQVSTDMCSAMGYKIAATLKNASTLKMTLGAARAHALVAVMQFRPDAGDTVTLEASGTANDNYVVDEHTVSSDQISPVGDDLCVVGGVGNYLRALSAQSIGDAGATGIIEHDNGYGSIWYTLFTASQTGIDADVTLANTDRSIINILAFKSSAASTGAVNVVYNII